jgi:hypothetical protein
MKYQKDEFSKELLNDDAIFVDFISINTEINGIYYEGSAASVNIIGVNKVIFSLNHMKAKLNLGKPAFPFMGQMQKVEVFFSQLKMLKQEIKQVAHMLCFRSGNCLNIMLRRGSNSMGKKLVRHPRQPPYFDLSDASMMKCPRHLISC